MTISISHRYLLGISLTSSLVLAACVESPEATTAQDMKARHPSWKQELANRALLHDYHVVVWEDGHFDQAAQFLAPSFTAHSVPILPGGQPAGPDFFPRFLGAFSNLDSHEDAILSGGDRVSLQWTITATQTGDFFGIAPTNRTIQFSGMDILRVEDGKFTDQWGGVADQVDDVVALLSAP